jgi:hypothetical protein
MMVTSHCEGQEQLRRWRQPMAGSYGGGGVGRRPSRAPITVALGSHGGSTPERRWSSPTDGRGGDGPRRRMVATEAALRSGAVGAQADGHGGTARRTAWRHGGARAPHRLTTGWRPSIRSAGATTVAYGAHELEARRRTDEALDSEGLFIFFNPCSVSLGTDFAGKDSFPEGLSKKW